MAAASWFSDATYGCYMRSLLVFRQLTLLSGHRGGKKKRHGTFLSEQSPALAPRFQIDLRHCCPSPLPGGLPSLGPALPQNAHPSLTGSDWPLAAVGEPRWLRVSRMELSRVVR